MPNGAGTHEATGKGVNELAIALPHGGLVTVQFNPYLVIEHPLIISQALLSLSHKHYYLLSQRYPSSEACRLFSRPHLLLTAAASSWSSYNFLTLTSDLYLNLNLKLNSIITPVPNPIGFSRSSV